MDAPLRPLGSPNPARTTAPMARAMTSIERGDMRFVVFDAPSAANLPVYLNELRDRSVKCIVRVCEPTYDKAAAESMGFAVYDWPFSDGSCPPHDVIVAFLKLCDERFSKSSTDAIGVHCIAGLGRAPVLVAIALIESGMTPLEAIEFVRRQRRGAFNSVQLAYLAESYKTVRKKGQPLLAAGKNASSGLNANDTDLKKKTSGVFASLGKVFKKS